ncbi:MAG: hypothetical protein ACFFG0_28265 [Candidatus Thorarchaeota archaeon]
MVELKDRGKLKEKLNELDGKDLKELCYILNLRRSGTVDDKIQEILYSEYDYQYIIDRMNFLIFGIMIHEYFFASELTDITYEYDLPRQRKKLDKMIEIIKSEEVTPRSLLGMLETEDIEELYIDIFKKEPEINRSNIINAIIRKYNLKWLDEMMDKGFILMAMKNDPFLENTYQIIKNECKNIDINAIRIDEIQTSALITKEVLDEIQSSEYIIVDLTLERPNVYYELGFTHGIGKDNEKIILLAKKGTNLHFDIRNMRTIIYENHEHLRKELKKRLKAIKSR